MALHAMERESDVDPIVALCVDAVRLAIEDYMHGPHGNAKRVKDYHSAACFLKRTGLLAVVEAHYGLKLDMDVERLVDEIA